MTRWTSSTTSGADGSCGVTDIALPNDSWWCAGKRYDAKAIAGVAVGYVGDALGPLAPVDFTSGQVAAIKLASLGVETSIKRHRTRRPPTT